MWRAAALHHLQVLQVRQPPPRLLPLLHLPCLRFRLRLRLRLRRRNELDPPPLLGHMRVLSQLVNLVLARLVPPPLDPPLDPPLVPLAPKGRTCNLKRLALPLVRPLSRLLARPPCRQGGQCLDRDPPALA